ncbi:uncharacterized protein LAJ45_10137 [Morchella importuna]|uniref:uncharacterized protein n=1 Tax=Morchella importuna TaxID=1174673 RepID=UPI001E8D71EB|nr:uncharacterized protein LAJ45_10137 [Morchella importuna]KAH8145814.1 hypothetical protein LAJ45_10137 [Morchella importuna]
MSYDLARWKILRDSRLCRWIGDSGTIRTNSFAAVLDDFFMFLPHPSTLVFGTVSPSDPADLTMSACDGQVFIKGVMSAIESQHENELNQCELEKHLVLAAEKGDLDAVKRLVQAGADIMGRYLPPPGTPLGGEYEILKIFDNRPRALVKANYYFEVEEQEMGVRQLGWTALQAASAGGHLSTVQFLLESGGDVNDPVSPAIAGRTALQWAAGTRNLELIQFLLDHGADANAKAEASGGRTALQMAVERGCQETVDLLLLSGADVNEDPALSYGKTALQAACVHGQLRLVQALLDRGARINECSSSNSTVTALSAAAGGGHLDIVELLIKKDANVNEKAPNTTDLTALQAAARKGHLKLVEFLLDHGAEVNTSIHDYSGRSALQTAVEQGNSDLTKLLISRGAEVNTNAANYYGRSALQAAAENGNIEMVELLLAAGANIGQEGSGVGGRTALQAAAEKEHIDIVKLLIGRGASANEEVMYSGGRTSLQAAASKGHMGIARLLVEKGADLNAEASSSHGLTALQAAADGGHKEMVRWLLSLGADVNWRGWFGQGRTALQAAAEHGHMDIARILLEGGANVNANIGSGLGSIALQVAAREGHIDMVKLLLDAKARVDGQAESDPSYPQTPLQAAAKRGHIEIAKCLLASGADINAEPAEFYGRSALQAAAEQGHREMVRWLLTEKADIHAKGAQHGGATAIEAAVKGGDREIVAMLVSRGASRSLAFRKAAAEGELHIVKMLHSQGVNVDGTADGEEKLNSPPETPLQSAVSWGVYDVVRFLLANKADINAPASGPGGMTALQSAASNGHLHVVQFLLVKGADVNAPASETGGRTALQAAAGTGNLEVVKHLLLMKADVNAPVSENGGRTALQAAAESGDLEVVKHLMSMKADVNEPASETNGRTALQAAAESGHVEVVKHLLLMKADINAPASETGGATALQAAARSGNLDIVKSFLSEGVDVNAAGAADGDGRTALDVALEYNNHDIALLLLKAGGKVYGTVGADGQSALHRVCDDETFDLFRAIAMECADEALNRTNLSGSTVLHVAVEGGHKKVISCLLGIPNLNKEIRDIQRNTPLKIAIQKDDTITAKLLLNTGARTDGLTPNELQIVANILKGKSTGSAKNEHDDSPLILLGHEYSSGTQVKRTCAERFEIDHWGIHEWEKNAKTSILFPSPDTQPDGTETLNTFVNPDSFLPNIEYETTTREDSLVQWGWLTFHQRYEWMSTEFHGFRKGIPTNQDMKSNANVLLAPYIRFDWPLIVVDAPKLKYAYAKAGQTTVIPFTNDVAEVSGFTSEKWRIEISWIMVKRNCSKKQVASPMQAIHFRGNIPRKVPSIPGSAAEFVVWFVADVCDHWIALLDKAGQQLVEIRDFQLIAEGRDSKFKESEVLFGELMIPLRKKTKKDRINKDNNTKTIRPTPLPPATLSQSDGPVATDNPRLVESSMPEPGILARRATQTIIKQPKNVQHVALAPPPTARADQAPKTTNIKDLPKIRELEKKVNQMEKLGERLSRLDRETKEMIELEFSLVSIHEARESVKMSQSMKRLSWITFIFLPLMFVAGLFGMNVDILESNPSWKWYPISAALFMAFVMLAWVLFKCRPISKSLKWYETRDPGSVIRNPRGCLEE